MSVCLSVRPSSMSSPSPCMLWITWSPPHLCCDWFILMTFGALSLGVWPTSGQERGPAGRGVQGLFDQSGLRCGERQAGRSSIRVQSVRMECRELLCPCLSTGGLCCFVLLQLDQAPSHSVCLSVRFLPSLLTVCAFLSFFHPQTLLTFSPTFWYLYFCSSSLLPALCFLLLHPLIPPSLSGLCCAVAAYRSDQDRWSQMISGLYSFLQETAWYCCWCMMLSQGVCRSNNIPVQFSSPVQSLNDLSWGGVLNHVLQS